MALQRTGACFLTSCVPALSGLRVSRRPRQLGRPLPPCIGGTASAAPLWDVRQEGGWLRCAHPGQHHRELLNWPLTLPLRQGEASLAQTIAGSSLPLSSLPFLGAPPHPLPWWRSPGEAQPRKGIQQSALGHSFECPPPLPSSPSSPSQARPRGGLTGPVGAQLLGELNHPALKAAVCSTSCVCVSTILAANGSSGFGEVED